PAQSLPFLRPDATPIGQIYPLSLHDALPISKISIVPIGKTTEASMKSNWNAPKFNGSFLPSHEITDNGFTADWKVLHINRPFAQQSFGFLPKVSQYSFDVDFIIPVDQYVQNDRASKYGFLI